MIVDELYALVKDLRLVKSPEDFSRRFLGQPDTYYGDCVAGGLEPGPISYAFLFCRIITLGRLISDQQIDLPQNLIVKAFADQIEEELGKCANRLNGLPENWPLTENRIPAGARPNALRSAVNSDKRNSRC